MVKWLYKKKEIDIVQFEFKRLPKTDTGNENVRRSTLTIEEYDRLARAMRSYIARTTKPNKNLEDLIFSEDGGKRMWAGIIGKEFKKTVSNG